MKKVRKFNAAVALGSLTAAVALLAGAPDASAQTAPGGGSFPGSFLVPGTNTSIKIGGYAKIVGIYDIKGVPAAAANVGNPDVEVPAAIPLSGSGAAGAHGALRFHARQSNINLDSRTPTAYGDLTIFLTADFFGQNTAQAQTGSNTQNARLVYAYGTLGGFLAGQAASLWADNDALPETVDPTPTVGVMNGSSQRQPQFRYTFAMANGISVAGSIENPEQEGVVNVAGAGAFTTSTLGGYDRLPDFIVRGRIDQAWGHFALTGILRDEALRTVPAAEPGVSIHAHKDGYGLEASGHVNTIGKDAFKFMAIIGKGLGHYITDLGGSGALQLSSVAVGSPDAGLAKQYSANISYTHWWTGMLRSTVNLGYLHNKDSGVITLAAAENAIEKRHIDALANLIWSPVPQVDLGIEYIYEKRNVQAASGTVGSSGTGHRIEVESVFKF
jgi:hypothetical protein